MALLYITIKLVCFSRFIPNSVITDKSTRASQLMSSEKHLTIFISLPTTHNFWAKCFTVELVTLSQSIMIMYLLSSVCHHNRVNTCFGEHSGSANINLCQQNELIFFSVCCWSSTFGSLTRSAKTMRRTDAKFRWYSNNGVHFRTWGINGELLKNSKNIYYVDDSGI